MKPAELNRAISEGRIPPLLFLYGEETFSLEKALQRLLDETVPAAERDFNFQVFYGRELEPEAVLDAARTLPVFGAKRLVLVKNAQDLSAAALDSFLPYLRAPLAETCLVFAGDKVDRRKKFFQEFKKHGALVEFKRLYDNQVPAFVREQAREAGRSFTEDALALFCRRVGSNLQEVHGELCKLFAYLGERTLADVADVREVVSDTRIDSIFELTNALGREDLGEGLRLLGRILEEGTPPLVVLSMMVRHFRQLWMTRALLEEGVEVRDIPRRIGANPYFMEGLASQARHFSAARYRRAFELFLETDLALKSSGAHPPALLEQLVLDLAGADAN